jgi:hypothetical protein
MNRLESPLDGLLHLMDRQVMDNENLMVCKCDDLEMEERDDGTRVVLPVNHQDSSLLANLAAAQVLLVRAPFAPKAEAGAACEVLRLPV